MTTHEFRLEYDLNRDDLIACTGFYWASWMLRDWILYPVAGIIGAGIGLGVIAAFYLFIVWLTDLQWDPQLNALFLFGAVAGFLLAISLTRRSDRDDLLSRLAALVASDSKNDVLTGEQELSIGARTLTATSQSIEITGPAGTTSRTWDCITQIAATESHVFIIADVAMIIPRRSFADDSMYLDFIESARHWSRQG